MYIPVSLLSTPPTIETTDRSYGDIVNEDFYQFELKNKNPQVSNIRKSLSNRNLSLFGLYQVFQFKDRLEFVWFISGLSV